MLKDFLRDVSENAISHGALPFWSWNDKLCEEELRRQIRNMHELEMNGFFMHARGGLETEYMSDEWYDAINVCIDEARKLGMEAWAYDENGWPSGFAGGKLLGDPKNFARYLVLTKQDAYPEEAALAVYRLDDGVARRVKKPEEGIDVHYVITVGEDFSYVDVLDATVVRKFIDATHEEYKKRIPSADFGSVMPGFFTDEPQYYRGATPWSNTIPDAFIAEYGYDPLDHLIKLFVDCEGFREFRFDYHKLLSRLYIESFAKQIYEWCMENGCRLTGHTIEESTVTGQLHCCAGVMQFYQYEHIPGIDYLSRPLKKDILAKQLGSVCAQTGRNKAITETFAMCGWDVSPTELKSIADMQYAGGVNMMCHHLYPYSIRGQRKRDYPAHYSTHLPWQKHLKDFNRYYNHLGYMLSRGTESVRTLVIHPLHHSYMYYVRERESEYIVSENGRLNALSDLLSENQIAYHYGDETMMKELARVDGATLTVGLCTYDRVIIPDVETLDASTVSLLSEYVANGGKIWLSGQTPTRVEARPTDLSWLQSNVTFEELKDTEEVIATLDGHRVADLRFMTRRTEHGRLIFVTNLRGKAYDGVQMTVRDCRNLLKLDILSLSPAPLFGECQEDGSFRAIIDIGISDSFVLVESDEMPTRPLAEYIPPNHTFFLPPRQAKVLSAPANTLTLDTLSYSLNGNAFSENVPLMQLKDELLRDRFDGELTVKHTFTVGAIPPSLHLAVEPLSYKSLTVNDHPVVFDNGFWLDPCFRTADIRHLVSEGLNEIQYTVDYRQSAHVYDVLFSDASESLRNCLSFDMEIECAYLLGDFRVDCDQARFADVAPSTLSYDGAFSIVPPRDTVDLTNTVKDGFPFFAGELCVSFVHRHEKNAPTALLLDGRYAVCEVLVNGQKADTLLFKNICDLSHALREGDNTVELRLTNGNRNLLGPLHHTAFEPTNVTPIHFTGEKSWKNGEWKFYDKEHYFFVRFGVDTSK